MARTIVGVNDPKAVKRYAGLLAMDASQKAYFSSKFVGKGSTAETPLQRLTHLETDAGESITYDLLAELKMAPVEGEDNLEGNEEALRHYTDTIYIDQARNGVNAGGKMTRKRPLSNLREQARLQQSKYWARVTDELCFMYLSGSRGINESFVFPLGYTGRANNAFVSPDTNHRIFGGAATAYNNIASTDKFDLGVIDKAKTRADVQGGGATGIPVLQPCKMDGNEAFVLVMHTYQEDDLRKNAGTGNWLDITKALATSEGARSPLRTGALGLYRGVVLHSHRNVIRFNDAGAGGNVEAARGLFMGAQAGIIAYGSPGTGMPFDWHEETRDNGDKVVISTSAIFGVKKTTFTTDEQGAQDFGVIALDTAAAIR